MILGLCGYKGVGKDSVASRISWGRSGVRFIALADPIKEAVRSWFDMPNVYGPSALREWEDRRYPYRFEDGREGYLTPRYVLQQLGTEFGRRLYPDIWINIALRHAAKLLDQDDDGTGSPNCASLVVITDVRFVDEARRIREAGGAVWRITRPGYGASGHGSEVEQGSLAMTGQVTAEICNDGTLADLEMRVKEALGAFDRHGGKVA